jgi:hypothetical protein
MGCVRSRSSEVRRNRSRFFLSENAHELNEINPTVEKKMDVPSNQRRKVSGTEFMAHTALSVGSTHTPDVLSICSDLHHELYIGQRSVAH